MTQFDSLGLGAKAMRSVERLGYSQPTPVQERAIPYVLQGLDIIAAAKTGTGKTAAFALPSMDKLGHAKGKQGPLMLVITPTRELASQIGDVCATISKDTKHRIQTVVGGVSYEPQKAALKRGVDVLIATPGRLIDLMDQNAVRLSDVQILVLDEADRMLDMGFIPSVRKIVAATPKQRQTLLFSATIDKSINQVAGDFLQDPELVEIAHKGEIADTIDQYIVRVAQDQKYPMLKAVLKERGSKRVIVFVRTRGRADSTTRRLKKAGYSVEAIHSDRSQNQRRRALENFTEGSTNIIVATDVLARGIDVDGVSYVINYDLPHIPEDYVHRIGRTGRAGERGFAVSFASPDAEADLKQIEKLVKTRIPELEIKGFDAEAVEADAARRNTKHAAKTDPDVAAAAREIAKKDKRKRKAAAKAKEAREEMTAKPGVTVTRKPKPARSKKVSVAAKAGSKPAKPAKSAKSAKPAKPQAGAKKSVSAKPAGDFRPGRSNRAAQAARRDAQANSRRSKKR